MYIRKTLCVALFICAVLSDVIEIDDEKLQEKIHQNETMLVKVFCELVYLNISFMPNGVHTVHKLNLFSSLLHWFIQTSRYSI
jgi:hypothetical protein